MVLYGSLYAIGAFRNYRCMLGTLEAHRIEHFQQSTPPSKRTLEAEAQAEAEAEVANAGSGSTATLEAQAPPHFH